MRFLADENIPGPVVRTLRGLGHEQRVALTCDHDFGELAFRVGLPASCGVVLFRMEWSNPREDNAFAVSALTSRDDWAGVFAVVERDRIRIRPLSKAGARERD
jgi:predicted nuclease of predicted toxin-antitoxin system